MRRFLLHILPAGIKRIRHYGILESACKKVKLGAARCALDMPLINPKALESANAFMARVAMVDASLCPCCKKGQLHIIETRPGLRRLPAPAGTVAPQNRGPP